ncbi:TetR/AcrR family transcriptional regulator [Kribbella deserti]|uniref:TetR/AcrR family transcriptional regulator n=1 Tax=Kribbella deserti TaxID=1926257 RepID=A0ABV6QZ41_9ACTN
MTVEHSGGGQPERILAMLWRHHRAVSGPADGKPALGRRPTLTLDAVVTAAIELADTEGLATMSMSRVAKALGVGTMTLYTYVPSKDELLDLMVDQVFAERDLPRSGDDLPANWRDRIELYAERTLAMFGRHTWLCEVSFIRPPIGPGMLDAREFLLAALSGIGLEPPQVDAAALAIATYVDGAASVRADGERLERQTGQSNDAWWGERNDLWETYFDVERYPAMTALWHAGGFNRGTTDAAAHSYRFGLDRLLDGIEAKVNKPG